MCKSRGIYRNTLPSKSLDLVVESSNVYYFTEGFTTSKPTTRTEDNLMSLGGSTVNAKVLVKRDGGAPSGAPYSAKVCGTSSCRRIPCKARGVSSKHVPENAYFDIPVNAPHGLLLSCSNIECARSIRKFRYCRGKLGYHWEIVCCFRFKTQPGRYANIVSPCYYATQFVHRRSPSETLSAGTVMVLSIPPKK